MSAAAKTVRERLAEGPPRGLGCVNGLVKEALASPESVLGLVQALGDERAVVTIRAANALNKVQQVSPSMVTKHGHTILHAALCCEDLRTRWNLTVVVGRLPLRGRDRALAVELMFEALGSRSGFLRTFAMTGLFEFSANDAALRKRVCPIVEKALTDASAAMRARARALWPRLQ